MLNLFHRLILILFFSIIALPIFIQTASAETACTSSSQCDDSNACTYDECIRRICAHKPKPAGTVCRAKTSWSCDVAETCNGISAACPADTGLITTCANGDRCCPAGCNAANDNNCAPVCGNSVVEGAEQCDDGNTNNTDGCTTSCIREYYVELSGSDSNPGTRASPWRTIQHAIDMALKRSVINIGEGRFIEKVNVTKAITLRGAGKERTFIVRHLFDSPLGHSIVTMRNAGPVVIEQLSISGWETWGDHSEIALYAENTPITLREIDIYAITNFYVVLIQSNFTIYRVSLRGAEWPAYRDNSDVGINILDSSGVIDGLENEHHIDHVINHTGHIWRLDASGLTLYEYYGDESGDLTVQNSIIRGQNFNWGDGIRFIGDGTNELLIHDNTFIGFSGITFPERSACASLVLHLLPNAISLGRVDAAISRNRIEGFPTGIFIQGSLGNTVSASANEIIDNGFGVFTLLTSSAYTLDFGGGSLGSPGMNTFNNQLYDIVHKRPETFFAGSNHWNTADRNEIDRRICDQNDTPTAGAVMYEPIIWP